MKAKAWVEKLVLLIQNEDSAFIEVAMECLSECLEITTLRLKNVNAQYHLPAQIAGVRRVAAAFREAAVKWESIRHGVSLKTGGGDHFPIVQGGIILKYVTYTSEQIRNASSNSMLSRNLYNDLVLVVKELSYQNIPWIAAMLEGIHAGIERREEQELGEAIVQFSDYQLLTIKKNLLGSVMDPDDLKRHGELEILLKDKFSQIRSSLKLRLTE